MKENILIFRIGSLGDAVVSLPCIHAIRDLNPLANITLLTNAPTKSGAKAVSAWSIFAGSRLIDDYIEYPPPGRFGLGMVRLQQTLWNRKFSALYYIMPPRNLWQLLRDKLFFGASGILRVHGTAVFDLGAQVHRQRSPSIFESEAARLLRVQGFSKSYLSASGFDIPAVTAQLSEISDRPTKLCIGKRFAICVGGKSPVRDWGDENWGQLLRMLDQKFGAAEFLFFGSADEKSRCEYLARQVSGKTTILAGESSPVESALALATADLLITHDTGPMHLAAAVGTVCVSIFADNNPRGIWFPFGSEEFVLYPVAKCASCHPDGCIAVGYTCIRTVQVEQVMQNILVALRSRPREAARNSRI